MCGYIAVELFYTTRTTDRSISTLLCVVILQWSSSIQQGPLIGQEYIYFVMCGYTAVKLFYTTRTTDRSISTLLCVVIQQWSSSIQQGPLIGVYQLCDVWLYCSGALLYNKDH